MHAKTLLGFLVTIPLLTAGCASIFDGGAKSVQINSNPSGAKLTVINRAGLPVYSGTTPTKISLARSSGYFAGEDYTLKFEMAGYAPSEAHVGSTIDGWYFGNIAFGGLIGMLIVDPLTGNMFTLDRKDVQCSLISMDAAVTGAVLATPQTETNRPSLSPDPQPTHQ